MRIHFLSSLCLCLLFCLTANAQSILQLQTTPRKVQLSSGLQQPAPAGGRPTTGEQCGFTYVMSKAAAKGFKNEEFEAQLKQMVQRRASQRTATTIYTIPIIFHIVHRGEPVGTAANISAAQVAAQIDQLNKDFSNLSNSTYGVSADVGLRFCAAVVDASGRPLAEPGIERINASTRGWANTATMSQDGVIDYFDNTIKPATIWDPYSFVNIWTADMDASGLLGYASFPTLSTLDGLQGSESDLTAGTVVDAATVGSLLSPGTMMSYNLGRTLTHELGHFFGLRHIWGDSPCGNDYCNDTPPQNNSTSGCPGGSVANGCSPSVFKMFENYMDYTDDACLNTFTADQAARIQTVMLNSPRRKELASSKACQARPGNAVQFTLAQSQQTETGTTGTCPLTKSLSVSVAVSVQATGSATLTFNTGGTAGAGSDYTVSPASVSFTAGDNTPKSVTITINDDKSIEPTETIQLGYTITGTGVLPGPDKQVMTISLFDDDFERQVRATPSVTLLNENFDASASTPAGWFIQNGFVNGWVISGNGGTGTTGNAAHITENQFARPNTYDENMESQAFLVTPLIDATGLSNVNVAFKWRCNGEEDFDEGYLGYILENDPNEVHFFNLVFNNSSTVQTLSGQLPASFNNTRFRLVFYWYNDDSFGNDPGFTVDDVVVTGQATSIESTVTHAATLPQYAGQTAQYITPDNQLVVRLAGLSENVGCITASVQNAGTGRTAIQTPRGSFFRTDKVIRVSPAAANTSASYQATLYFSVAELSSAWTPAEIANLKILKVKDGVNLSGLITTADAQLVTPAFSDNSASGGYYAYTGNFTGGFSQFMLVSPNFILPVNLLTFEAQPSKRSIELSWKTAAETNNKGFSIERSTNGSDFTAIGWVNGAGTTNEVSSYRYTDNFVQPNTVYYYRLNQVDKDNRSRHSGVKQARISESRVAITLSPNPARNQVKLFVSGSTKPANVSLVNAKGQTVARWTNVNLGTPYSINISRFAQGLYTLVIHLEEGDRSEPLIIQ